MGGDPAPAGINMHLDIAAALLNVILLWILTAPHEFAHAWVATKLGDDTPRLEGRVTLHPLAHVDWIGTALLPFLTSLMGAGFLGWGKPVNTNPAKLKGGWNGMAIVALAGPFSNVILAVILAVIYVSTLSVLPPLAHFAGRGVTLSLYLAIFNMLPIPPLDGSKLLLAARIPMRVYVELARFGFMLLVVVIAMTGIGPWMSLWADRAAVAIVGLFR
jgi:Zn-dependent protease